jgi:hypothetical protein
MPGQENELIKGALDFLTRNGIMAWRNNNTGGFKTEWGYIRGPWTYCEETGNVRLKGICDILGTLSDGKILAAEAKVGGRKPTPEQEEFIKSVLKLGGVAFVFWSIEDMIRELRKKGYKVKR